MYFVGIRWIEKIFRLRKRGDRPLEIVCIISRLFPILDANLSPDLNRDVFYILYQLSPGVGCHI